MKKIFAVISILFVFGCNSDPDKDHTDPQPQQYFGYLGTAMQGLGTGNYIAELSISSNIATISSEDSEDTDYIIDLIIEARNHGMESIIWVDGLFFCIKKWGTPEQELYLYPDYQERWDKYSPDLIPYEDSILMFYVLDEAIHNGLKVGISQADMLVMLETVASTIKATFPDVEVGSCFAYPSITDDLELPGSYTMVGFDYYYYPPQDMNTYFNSYLDYLELLKSKMYSYQKLFLVPGGLQFVHSPASQDDLILVADFFYDLFLTEPLADMMIAFLYPSVPPGLIGLDALPELMTKYEEIGNLIINPDEIIESKEPKEEITNYIQRKSTNTSSIEEEFHDLYDQAIDMIVKSDINLNEDDLYEQANELVSQAQIIADELFYGETTEHTQHLITILTKDYGELYISIRTNVDFFI